MVKANLINVPIGLLMVFKDCYGFSAGIEAMKLVRDIHKHDGIGAVSLPVDKSLQPRLDHAFRHGKLSIMPENKISVGRIDGEPVLFLGKAMGALDLVINMASHLKVPSYASCEFSLPPQAGCEFTASRLYDLHEKHGFLIHICTPQDAKIIAARL